MEHIKSKFRQGIGVDGLVTVNVLEPKSERDFEIIQEIRKNQAELKMIDVLSDIEKKHIYKKNKDLQDELEASCLVRKVQQHNIVTTAGLTQITKGLSTNLSTLSELEINYAAVGTGTGAPAAGDTTLDTESYRNVVNSLNYSSNILFASMFIDFTEDSGTYYEAGLFINGTASADSGSLFDRVLLNSPTGITKTTSQVLTVSFQITFTPV